MSRIQSILCLGCNQMAILVFATNPKDWTRWLSPEVIKKSLVTTFLRRIPSIHATKLNVIQRTMAKANYSKKIWRLKTTQIILLIWIRDLGGRIIRPNISNYNMILWMTHLISINCLNLWITLSYSSRFLNDTCSNIILSIYLNLMNKVIPLKLTSSILKNFAISSSKTRSIPKCSRSN